jgi:hypothetical protein
MRLITLSLTPEPGQNIIINPQRNLRFSNHGFQSLSEDRSGKDLGSYLRVVGKIDIRIPQVIYALPIRMGFVRNMLFLHILSPFVLK